MPKLTNKSGKTNDSGVKHNPSLDSDGLAHIAAVPAGWMEKIKSRTNVRTVTANEITSLSALISYAAHKSGTSEFRIERDLADRFHVANVTCLPESCYDEAMRYLVDRVPV